LTLGVVCGLAAEARIAAAAGLDARVSGGDPARAAQATRSLIADGATLIVSFGLAGGLEASLRPGTLVIADAVRDGLVRYDLDPAWPARLRAALPGAVIGEVAGVDRPASTAAAKATLATIGAVAVDMESHAIVRIASVPVLVVRAVADPVTMTLPQAARVPLRVSGRVDLPRVLASVARHPGQVPDLARLARMTGTAFASLRRAAAALAAQPGWNSSTGLPEGSSTRI
jgi:hopanoid-associated phosphorylase